LLLLVLSIGIRLQKHGIIFFHCGRVYSSTQCFFLNEANAIPTREKIKAGNIKDEILSCCSTCC